MITNITNNGNNIKPKKLKTNTMDEINDVKAPVETNEESPMIKWARREVEIVLQQLTQRQRITDYDRECYTACLLYTSPSPRD